MDDKRKLLLLMAVEMQKALLLAKYIYKRKIAKENCSKRNIKAMGYLYALVPEMRLNDVESFVNFHRKDPTTFDDILRILGPRYKKLITPAERYLLGSGDLMKSAGYYGFRISASTTSKIVRETTELIWQKLQFVFRKPSTNMWKNIACNFYK